MAYITKATYVFDVNSQLDIVEVEYTKYVHGNGWKKHKDWVYTYPEGDWTEITFGDLSPVKYVDFLNSMVFKNLEVHRKIATLSLDSVSKKSPKKLLRLMNAIRILDPTFEPPEINIYSAWQMSLLKHIALGTSHEIIASCKNKKRINKYFRVVQLI
jgi:hypothetical protein